MKKRTITLAFDCYIGPIVGVAVDENGREITKIRVVDDDVDVRTIAEEARKLWFSLFRNVDLTDENPAGFEFDENREKEIAPELLFLIEKLVRRLEKINDGSFQIEDWATPKLKGIISGKANENRK